MFPAGWFDWIPCTYGENTIMWLNPYIPWPHDHLAVKPTCQLRLNRLIEQVGWGQARLHPEVRRLESMAEAW